MTNKKVGFVVIAMLVFVAIGAIILIRNNRSKNVSKNNMTQDTSRQITNDEVGKHATSSDCWVVIDGKVYNVTDYVSNHPGGEAILQGCGKDATGMFNSRPNDGTSHSLRARNTLSQYQIGVLTK